MRCYNKHAYYINGKLTMFLLTYGSGRGQFGMEKHYISLPSPPKKPHQNKQTKQNLLLDHN